MKAFKITIVSVIFMAISTLLSLAQDNVDFKSFVSIFPQRNYPFKDSYDDGTELEDELPNISESFFEKFIFQKNYFPVKEKERICFSGFLAIGQFVTHQPFHLLLIAKDSKVSGCGEEEWLVTYTVKGEIIDTLFVFGRSTNYSNKEKKIPFTVEFMITTDSISVKKEETIQSLIKISDKKYKSIIKVYNMVYHVSSEGKFIKNREDIRVEDLFLK